MRKLQIAKELTDLLKVWRVDTMIIFIEFKRKIWRELLTGLRNKGLKDIWSLMPIRSESNETIQDRTNKENEPAHQTNKPSKGNMKKSQKCQNKAIFHHNAYN